MENGEHFETMTIRVYERRAQGFIPRPSLVLKRHMPVHVLKISREFLRPTTSMSYPSPKLQGIHEIHLRQRSYCLTERIPGHGFGETTVLSTAAEQWFTRA